MGEIRFTKIKMDKLGRVILKYEEAIDDEKKNEYSMKCTDQPRPQFKEAFNDLRKHVLEICEFPMTNSDIDKIDVRGVSLSWTNDIMGAVIMAQKRLINANSPLILNTPHLPSVPYSENGDITLCLSSDCIFEIEQLIKEADLYLVGERAQMDLFLGENGKESKRLTLEEAEAAATIGE